MVDEERTVKTQFLAHPSVLSAFREAVLHRHGTVYRTINTEFEEALRFWTRVLRGEVKPPK